MDDIRYEASTAKTFDEAVSSITKSLAEQNFGVLWKLNFKDKLSEKGITFDKNFMIFEVCNPQKAKEVLTKHLDIGYFLPCKLVVYEDENGVKIGTVKPQNLIGMLGHEDLEDIAAEVQKVMVTAINNAI